MKWYKLLILILGIVLLVGGVYGWRTWERVFGPATRFVDEQEVVLVPSGATFEQVMDTLRAHSVIDDEAAFEWLAGRKNYKERIKPGRYVIDRGTTLNALLNKLRSGDQDPVNITFTNVDNLPELAGRVARYVEVDSLSFLKVFLDPEVHRRVGLEEHTFISLFLPNTYEFWWTTTPEKFITRMEQEHDRFWSEERLGKAAGLRMDPVQVATLASIVQAETMRKQDAPRIAGVYLNRLRIGMPLQADPTLKFALGADSLRRVLDRDKLVDSPYNTYRYAGLPPGPINMPEPSSIDAVLEAEKHAFLYFCAKADLSGYSEFSRTYDQHLVNARRYQRALDKRGIYR